MLSNPQLLLAGFTAIDLAGVLLLLFGWVLIGWVIEHPPASRPSTHTLMVHYRRRWMMEMQARDVRIFDSAVLNGLRQGTTFFASACMIAIGGGAALIGQAEQLISVAQDIAPALADPKVVLEVKLIVVVLIVTSAFLKFVWSHRLFSYAAVVMAAVPNLGADNEGERMRMAERAASLQITGARSFNRGLRALYFALAALAWLLGPIAFLLATTATLMMLYRREFSSASRKALLPD
ncbi:MAG: DUF599 domain-containing protein [Pseudomonadota bacterium]